MLIKDVQAMSLPVVVCGIFHKQMKEALRKRTNAEGCRRDQYADRFRENNQTRVQIASVGGGERNVT